MVELVVMFNLLQDGNECELPMTTLFEKDGVDYLLYSLSLHWVYGALGVCELTFELAIDH